MNIIFLGPQGSGKSTQAKMLADHLNLPYIEMGQIFRDKSQEEGDIAKQIKASLEAGELVPDEIAVKTLNEKLEAPDCQNGFILDGYPRNQYQMDGLKSKIDVVFYVKVSDTEAVNRLFLRGRHDDTEELLKRRLEIYHEKTEPLLKNFKNQGILIDINGEQSIEDVAADIIKKIDEK